MYSILYADIDRCVGCHACEVACRQEHDVPLDENRIRVLETKPQKVNEKTTFYFIPVVTDKCTFARSRYVNSAQNLVDKALAPACVSSCPTKALGYSDIYQLAKLAHKRKMIHILKIV